ncbi:hypothetical protein TVAG_171470 [Trichomonas vaginalis G3]|uniref:Uncharacterized protein n=1 Tax=Trichomonas vaginalis (strain ATCC PRA-98 / G3) TaxID=412133 RepID=A2FZK9_TRIV3|nr:SNARE fusion complex family [Trichomonas vaginalis G3]EAX89667.1 hypothetical protein TVAG_171470 [Trichomonas vaginalis G3]KAI5495867.1 SNARE fusion complex family [Trichomonas vaginalis G3]|eukprot:XP_001302597.1 hypothetical protein [Trichomonas vaginalis G3]
MSKGVNEEISKLEMASVEILNGMKSIQGMTALLELILQQQSKKIRNIEDQVANTLREVEASNRSLKVAKHHQL